ncbi:NfeD family protein [Maribellus mangrovi]|uniref:NfeD family protein n=1 Tax=Maribellus mangrovi TaxID=3133146 RepID=UPI0030EE3A76
MRKYWILLLLLVSLVVYAQETQKALVYKINIMQNITPATQRQVKQAFAEADSLHADYFLIHMNTYGGTVLDADSIRTMILQSKIPVYVFIDNNAASAGALISIACDGIYMRPGSSIGAATVVNQTGEAMPDKYQSYMRSTMRATAEAHGKDTIITAENDTLFEWFRDPLIAEAMVDQSIYVEGISDTGKVLTFTPMEAMEHGFCEGIAETVDEVMEQIGVEDFELVTYEPTLIEKIIGFLVNPVVSGLLIMAIIGGIYFEMQSPGIGFPLGIAILAAILYFAPLYLEGLAANWEIVIFVVGIILIFIEIFAIPGFGVAGIIGVILVFTGLVLSLVDNVNFDFEGVQLRGFGVAVTTVVLGIFGGFLMALYLGRKVFTAESGMFKNFALNTVQHANEGYISVETSMLTLKGKEGHAHTVLRPGGKVMIEGEVYDAIAETGFIERAEQVVVTRIEATQIYVDKPENS